MNKTVIHVEHGGNYVGKGDKIRWDSKEANGYALTFKEEITYETLMGRICKKIGIDATTVKVKLSYIPLVLKPPKILDILDDDDVDGYVWVVDKNQCRSAVNVEVIQLNEQGFMGESSVDVDKAVTPNEEQARNEETTTNEEPEGNYGMGREHGVNVDEYIELSCEEVREQCLEEWDDGTGLELGQEFVAKEQVQNLVLRAAFKECYDFNLLNSDTWRYVVRCKAEGCRWYLRLSRPQFSANEVWTVRVYRKMHSCSRASTNTSANTKKGTPQLVADVIHEEFPGVLETPPAKLLMDLVLSKVGVKLSYKTALRGKHLAVAVIRGSPEDSYMKLPAYLDVLEKVNVGTKTSLLLDDKNRFKYVFVALGACIKGYKAMRKVITVDATFLKYGGVLVFAMAQDPNHHHYPIAFGVLDGEKDVSWDWFFRQLLAVVPDDKELVFVSDRNASLIKAIFVVYKEAYHAFCVYHLSRNVRGRAPSGSKEYVGNKFMELAGIYKQVEFDKEYGDFKRRFPKVAEYLGNSVELDKWARSYVKGVRYNIETTNSAESMNNVFKKARMYALLPMIDAIVAKILEWFNKHRKGAANVPITHKMVPFVENKLHESYKIGSKLKVQVLNSFLREFCVIGKDGKSYNADLMNVSCSCKRLDIDKYPCVHAVAAVLVYGKLPERIVDMNVTDLCSNYFKVETWAMAYCETIYTVPHESHWQISDEIRSKVSLPPDYPSKRGRSQENRFPTPGEHSRKRRSTSNKCHPERSLGEWFGVPRES